MPELNEQISTLSIGGIIDMGDAPPEQPVAPAAQPVAEPAEAPAAAAVEAVGDGKDYEIVIEDSPEPVVIDPKAPTYEHVDKQITNKDIQKRIARLAVEKKAALSEAEKYKRMLDAALQVGDALSARMKAMATDTHTTTRAAVSIAAEKNKADIASAENELIQAQADGDAKRIAEATKRLSKATYESAMVEQIAVPEQPQDDFEEIERHQQFRQFAQQMAQQPVQAMLPPPEHFMSWLQENSSWYIADPNKLASANPLHVQSTLLANQISSMLVGEGLDVDTPEHFAELNRRLSASAPKIFGSGQQRQQPVEYQPQAPTAPPVRASVAPVAPVGNRAPATPRRTEKFTKEQEEFAKRWDMTLDDLVEQRNGVVIK